jgi:SIR2-like domain
MTIREDSILFLLGAGASVDAGIMHAKQMTDDIENKVKEDIKFTEFKSLYNFLKSSIVYQRGLEGDFNNHNATIEDLLNVMFEINQKHHNKLYPFIGGWNVHLLKVAGDDFEKVSELDGKIREQLFKWINIPNYDNSSYFMKLGCLANEIGSPLRVFTLNYDLCVEKALIKNSISIELGFDEDRRWESSRFEGNQNIDSVVYLYKLHGSIDWIRNVRNGFLEKCDSPQDNPELIFGTTAKLSSIDPYLFYVHEFRKFSLKEPLLLIVTIGYSFSDDYINRLISQALMRNQAIKVLAVSPSANKPEEASRIVKLLKTDDNRVMGEGCTARDFFESKMNLDYFEEKSSKHDAAPF